MKTKFIILLLLLGTTISYAQHDHSQSGEALKTTAVRFKDANFTEAYNGYIALKNALVASKPDEAQRAAVALQKALSAIPNAATAASAAEKIAASADLKLQRQSFSELSNEVASLVKTNKPTTGSIYLEYCPMANNNTGAQWLSNEKAIMNPYFGNAMLHCGSVTETIE